MCPLWAQVCDVAATQKCLPCLEPGGGRVVVRTVSITEVKAVVFPNWFLGIQQHPHLKAKWERDEDWGGHSNGRDRQKERKCPGHRTRREEGDTADMSHLPLDAPLRKPSLSLRMSLEKVPSHWPPSGHLRRVLPTCQGPTTPWHQGSPTLLPSRSGNSVPATGLTGMWPALPG